MINIYKANLLRNIKNVCYLGGLLIALVVTITVSSKAMVPIFLEKYEPAQCMLFVSVAMVLFFSIYIPVYTSTEYSDGILKNRIIAGHSQKDCFIAAVLSNMTIVTIMTLVYVLAGVIAGAGVGSVIVNVISILFALLGYTVFITALSFTGKKMIRNTVYGMVIFFLSFNLMLIGNAALAFSKGTAFEIFRILYNITPVGQWFANTAFADSYANPGACIQILISAVIASLSILFTILKVSKRDITN